MKKTLLLSILIAFIFSGCFSFSSLNPFSSDEEIKEGNTKKIELNGNIPDGAPQWIKEPYMTGFVTSLSSAKIKDNTNLSFDRKRALHKAGLSLVKNIYSNTKKLYIDYAKKTNSLKDKEEQIKKLAEHISLKALTKSTDKKSWIDSDKSFYILIGVETDFVIEQIQKSSKLIFESNDLLYESFLSNKAQKDIRKRLNN